MIFFYAFPCSSLSLLSFHSFISALSFQTRHHLLALLNHNLNENRKINRNTNSFQFAWNTNSVCLDFTFAFDYSWQIRADHCAKSTVSILTHTHTHTLTSCSGIWEHETVPVWPHPRLVSSRFAFVLVNLRSFTFLVFRLLYFIFGVWSAAAAPSCVRRRPVLCTSLQRVLVVPALI